MYICGMYRARVAGSLKVFKKSAVKLCTKVCMHQICISLVEVTRIFFAAKEVERRRLPIVAAKGVAAGVCERT